MCLASSTFWKAKLLMEHRIWDSCCFIVKLRPFREFWSGGQIPSDWNWSDWAEAGIPKREVCGPRSNPAKLGMARRCRSVFQLFYSPSGNFMEEIREDSRPLTAIIPAPPITFRHHISLIDFVFDLYDCFMLSELRREIGWSLWSSAFLPSSAVKVDLWPSWPRNLAPQIVSGIIEELLGGEVAWLREQNVPLIWLSGKFIAATGSGYRRAAGWVASWWSRSWRASATSKTKWPGKLPCQWPRRQREWHKVPSNGGRNLSRQTGGLLGGKGHYILFLRSCFQKAAQ